jgi:hypothetical protein
MTTPHDLERDASALLSALTELHTLARAFSESSTAIEFGTTLRVAVVVDAASPWRLIEAERLTGGRLRRVRMLCFASFEEMRRALRNRLDWVAADQHFRATHMATLAGYPGVTADWVHSKDFGSIFGPSRYWLREDICAPSSAKALILR